MMRNPIKMRGRFTLLNCCLWPTSSAPQSAASSGFESFRTSNSLFYPVDSVFACFNLDDSKALKRKRSHSVGTISHRTTTKERRSTDASEHFCDTETIGFPNMGPRPYGFSDNSEQRNAHEKVLCGGSDVGPLFANALSSMREGSTEPVPNPGCVNASVPVVAVEEGVKYPRAIESHLARTLKVDTQSPNSAVVEGEARVLTSNVGPCLLQDYDRKQEEELPASIVIDDTSQKGVVSEVAVSDETAPRTSPTKSATVSKPRADEDTDVAITSALTESQSTAVELNSIPPTRSMSNESSKPSESTRHVSDDPPKCLARPSSPTSQLQSPRKEWTAAVPQPHYSVGNTTSHPHTEDPFTCPPNIGNACYLSCGFENNGTMKLTYAHDVSSVTGRILGFARISSEMVVPAFKYKQPVVVGKSVYKNALYAYSGVGALVRVARRLGAEVTLFPLPPGFPALVVLYNFADEAFKIQCPGESQPKEESFSSVLVNETCLAVAVADPRVTKNVHTASRVSPAVFKLQFASKISESLLIDFRLE